MGVHPLPRTGLIGALTLIVLLVLPLPAAAALPPFELVRQSLVQVRSQQKSVELDLNVTQTRGELVEWKLSGTFPTGSVPKRLEGDDVPIQLLWITLLSADPVSELQRRFGVVNAARATVGVQEQFVYVYGVTPSVSVFRDLKRLAALSVRNGEHRWVIRLTWDESRLMGAMVTRDGRTVLTARAAATRPSQRAP